MRQVVVSALALSVLSLPAAAQGMSNDELAATVRRLAARVEALEAKSQRDDAELRALRGPRRLPPQRVVKGEPSVTVAVPVAVEAPNPFAGPYVAALVSHQISSRPDIASPTGFPDSDAPLGALSSTGFGGAIGYNVTSGPFLVGAEARFRGFIGERRASQIFPVAAAPLSRSIVQIDRYFGGDASGRVGVTFDDWLVYGRVGLGADAVRRRNATVGLGPNSFRFATVSMSGSPYVVTGAGVERNFGPFFARLEGNVYTRFGDTYFGNNQTAVSYNAEILGAVGYRF